jgi:hypothetical protein
MEAAMNPKVNVTSAEFESKLTGSAPRDFPQMVFKDVDYITAHTVFAQFFATNPDKKPTPAAKGKMPNSWLGRVFASD